MAIEIKNLSGKVLHVVEGDTLRGVNLHGAGLQGADLQWENLQDANLQGADLQRADLTGADLQRADLYNVNLQGAKLQEADFWLANLQRANLQRANFQGAKLQRANFQGAKLQGANFWLVNLQGANFTGADIKYVDFTGANDMDKAIGLNVGKQASQLEQEWGPTLKTAWGPSTEGRLDKAEEVVKNLNASLYVAMAYISDSWMEAEDIVWVRVEIYPKIQDDAKPGASTLRLKSEIGKMVSRYKLQTDKFISPKQNWTYKHDEFDPRALIDFYKKHPYIWEFRYRLG